MLIDMGPRFLLNYYVFFFIDLCVFFNLTVETGKLFIVF